MTLHARGVALRSLIAQRDTTTPQGAFLFSVFGTLAQYERAWHCQRNVEHYTNVPCFKDVSYFRAFENPCILPDDRCKVSQAAVCRSAIWHEVDHAFIRHGLPRRVSS